MNRPSIEDLKQIQKSIKLLESHIVYLDEQGFVIAHTDEERHYAAVMREGLENICELHQSLARAESLERIDADASGNRLEAGYYVVEQISADEFHNGPLLSPVRWKFLPIFMHKGEVKAIVK
jgi:hypothetical protein